jgi:GNAT superfamily N-acetyltransferase
MIYRAMKPEDIPAGLSLCRFAGWNQTARDWELLLQLGPDACRVAADEEGKIVGTVTTIRYEDHFSWIGMVLVHPDRQRQGIGVQLLREALHVLSSEETIKLDATPAGREIYLQLDFADEYRISRMQAKGPVATDSSGPATRPIQRKDMPSVVAFDREVFGADRQRLLDWQLQGAPQCAFLLEEESQIKGYCFARQGHHFTHIGPVVAGTVASAKGIFSAALQNCEGPIVVDALHHTPEWNQWLTSMGFEEQRPLIRMFRGTNTFPGHPANQFAILGPEFG